MNIPQLTLFHNPQSRSAGVRILLEELNLPATFTLIDFKAPEKNPALLAANPLGKVPTLIADGVVVTEQAAIYQFLAELKPEAGLSPAVGDALRGSYLRALTFYGSSFEPAMIDKALKRDAGQPGMSPYGDQAAVEQWVRSQLSVGPWFLGERYTAADCLWGTALGWMTRFGLLEATPEITAYLERFAARPAVQRARALDQALLAG
jgi:glutathione S-transferase